MRKSFTKKASRIGVPISVPSATPTGTNVTSTGRKRKTGNEKEDGYKKRKLLKHNNSQGSSSDKFSSSQRQIVLSDSEGEIKSSGSLNPKGVSKKLSKRVRCISFNSDEEPEIRNSRKTEQVYVQIEEEGRTEEDELAEEYTNEPKPALRRSFLSKMHTGRMSLNPSKAATKRSFESIRAPGTPELDSKYERNETSRRPFNLSRTRSSESKKASKSQERKETSIYPEHNETDRYPFNLTRTRSSENKETNESQEHRGKNLYPERSETSSHSNSSSSSMRLLRSVRRLKSASSHDTTYSHTDPLRTRTRLELRKPSRQKEEEYSPKREDFRFFDRDRHLLAYPYSGPKQHAVVWEDAERLKGDRFLNDTIIDLYPKIWNDEFPQNKIHAFSSFFYTKLKTCTSPENFKSLAKWTKGTDIFEKELLIIPIAENNHWFLVVVLNPGACVEPKLAKKLSNEELNRQKPYIMAIDSLGGLQKHTHRCISNYIEKEAEVRFGITKQEFITPEFISLDAPMQDNSYDCGVYCLNTIYQFYSDPENILSMIYKYKSIIAENMDEQHKKLKEYRFELRNLLFKHVKTYQETRTKT